MTDGRGRLVTVDARPERLERDFLDGVVTAYPQTVPPSTTPGRRVARASLDRGVRAGDLPESAPCRGAGTLRSRSVGRMRQIRCLIPDLPRGSALRVGSPADASDAPLQGGPILAGLPRIPPTGGWRRRALVDPGAGRRVAAVVGPWSGAPRASVEAPTRSAEIRGWSEPIQRTCRIPPDRPRAEVPRAVDRADDRGPPPARHRRTAAFVTPVPYTAMKKAVVG